MSEGSEEILPIENPPEIVWGENRSLLLTLRYIQQILRSDPETASDLLSVAYLDARQIIEDADVFVASPAWKQGDINAGIFTINFYSDAKSEGSALSIGPDYSTFGNPGAAKNGAAITFDQWFHLHVVIDPAGSARLELGAQVLEQTFPPLSPNAGAITTVELGISGYNKPCPQFDVWYDNVTIDFQ